MIEPLSRRTFLRGAGTVLALPLFEAMGEARRAESPAPRRLVWMYVPNGAHMPDWVPAAEGRDFELPPTLTPLAPYRDRLAVLGGLACDKARANGDGPGDHARAAAAFLTGVQPLKTDGQVRVGPSADQIAAAAIGDRTRFRSLVLGCERGRLSGQCDSGYACAYSSNVSWLSETTPAAREVDPRIVFDRFFRGGDDALTATAAAERRARRRSVLDFVREDARSLRAALGAEDRRKLDEYESGVRELERRIEFAERQYVAEVPDSARPEGIPGDFGEHVRLMADLIALAFRTDSTRIATLLVANEGSNRPYRNLETPDGHHDLSHHGNDPEKQAKLGRINRCHVALLAHLVMRLAEVREGEGSLLDSTAIVYGAAIRDGNRHDHEDLPVLFLGDAEVGLELGAYRRWEKETPVMNLHLALLRYAGVAVERLGDSTGVLE